MQMQGVFDGAVFSGCDLSHAQLDGSSFVGARYIGCTTENVSILDATVDWFKCRVCEKVFCNETNGSRQCRRHTDMFTGKGYVAPFPRYFFVTIWQVLALLQQHRSG
jgi:hypothetical protein